MNKEIFSKLKFYYENIFDPKELIDLVGTDNFNHVEFACFSFPKYIQQKGQIQYMINDKTGEYILDENGKKIPQKKVYSVRKKSFKDTEDLRKWLCDFYGYGKFFGPPMTAYYGSKYDTELNEHMKLNDVKWVESDFKIDIDIDGSTKIRNNQCECLGKTICNNCLRLALEAARHIILVLHDDFGFKEKDSVTYFSGREGLHIHYPKLRNIDKYGRSSYEKQYRKKIINYVQYCDEILDPKLKKIIKKENAKPEDFIFRMLKPIKSKNHPIRSESIRKKINSYITYHYFNNSSDEKFLEAQWKHNGNILANNVEVLKRIKKLKSDVQNQYIKTLKTPLYYENYKVEKNNTFSMVFFKNFSKKYGLDYHSVLENVIMYRYPRYDDRVSYDIGRIFKMPQSVDARTEKKYIIQKIPTDDILNFSFKLDQLATLDDMINNFKS